MSVMRKTLTFEINVLLSSNCIVELRRLSLQSPATNYSSRMARLFSTMLVIFSCPAIEIAEFSGEKYIKAEKQWHYVKVRCSVSFGRKYCPKNHLLGNKAFIT